MYFFFFVWVHITSEQVNTQSTAIQVAFPGTDSNAKNYTALNTGNKEAQLSGG